MALSSVTFDGFDLHIEQAGTRWRVTNIEGWSQAPDMRRDRQPRPGVPGDFATFGVRAGRDITVEGLTTCPDPGTAAVLARTFNGVSQFGTFSVIDAGGELTAQCEVDAGPAPVWLNDRIFSWSLALHAADPTRYGRETFTSLPLPQVVAGSGWPWPVAYPIDWGDSSGGGSSTVLPNDGTATYWPRARISGPVTNPTLTMDTGEWVRFNLTLASDQWLDVDFRNRRVLLNGAASRRQLVTTSYGSTWLGVPPGGARLSWAADNTNDTARLSVWAYQGGWL